MSGTPWNEGQKAYFPNPALAFNLAKRSIVPAFLADGVRIPPFPSLGVT